MNNAYLDLLQNNLFVMVKVSLPYLLILLIIGLIVGLLQAATQVNEPATPFVIKVFALIFAVWILGSWSVDLLAQTFKENLNAISSFKPPAK